MFNTINAKAITSTMYFNKGDAIKIKYELYDEDTRIWGKNYHLYRYGGEYSHSTDDISNINRNVYTIQKNNDIIIAKKGTLKHNSSTYFIVNNKEYPFEYIFGYVPLNKYFEKIQ